MKSKYELIEIEYLNMYNTPFQWSATVRRLDPDDSTYYVSTDRGTSPRHAIRLAKSRWKSARSLRKKIAKWGSKVKNGIETRT